MIIRRKHLTRNHLKKNKRTWRPHIPGWVALANLGKKRAGNERKVGRTNQTITITSVPSPKIHIEPKNVGRENPARFNISIEQATEQTNFPTTSNQLSDHNNYQLQTPLPTTWSNKTITTTNPQHRCSSTTTTTHDVRERWNFLRPSVVVSDKRVVGWQW